MRFAERGVAFLVYILLVFAIAMCAIWIDLSERSTSLINAGLLSAAIIIFIQTSLAITYSEMAGWSD